MADQLVFYHNPMSRGPIVRWMVEAVGAPYDRCAQRTAYKRANG